MDIEGWEWVTFESLFESTFLQTYVKQLGVEVHVVNASRIEKEVAILRHLETVVGFRRWYIQINNYVKSLVSPQDRTIYRCCYEMVFINERFLDN